MSNATVFVLLILATPVLLALAAIVTGFLRGIREFWREGPR